MIRTHAKKRSITANASTQFALYPLLRDWAVQEIKASPHLTELNQHLAVYISACDIVDVFKQVKYKSLTTAEAKCRLLQDASKSLELHKALYGTEHIKPKFAC